MAFFRLFPKVGYDIENSGVLNNVVNIYRSVRPLMDFIDGVSEYNYYSVQNGERPDIVSQRLYGTPDYYWTFFIINEFLHDGLSAWPLSEEALFNYMEIEYNGYAINTNPQIIRNTDKLITDYENSLAGRFKIGETITGNTNNATGTLTKKLVDLNQLIIQDVTGNFIAPEAITGNESEDFVSTNEVFKYIDAPYSYYREDDIHQRIEDNGIFINGGTPESDLAYITNRQWLNMRNEQRSKIRVIDPNYIEQFVDKFEKAINND